MSTETSDYVLSNIAEAERLRVQARIWEPDVELLLDQIGVQPGWRCLDLGCGAIGILEPLSRRVGPRGHVVGIDKDLRLLAAARAYVAEQGLTNVEILERDALNSGLARESFDLVHARFIMAFGHASDLFHEMLALAQPGGVVVSQETDQNSWCYFPQRPVWPRLKQTIEAAFLHMGGDANIGQQTHAMFRACRCPAQRIQLVHRELAVVAFGPAQCTCAIIAHMSDAAYRISHDLSLTEPIVAIRTGMAQRIGGRPHPPECIVARQRGDIRDWRGRSSEDVVTGGRGRATETIEGGMSDHAERIDRLVCTPERIVARLEGDIQSGMVMSKGAQSMATASG
jgi:SAM-dependent methyltransferase